MKNIYSNLNEAIKKGIIYIFGSNLLMQIIKFATNIFVIRNLSKIEYGYFTGANNLYSYVAIFLGMGMSSSIIQFCSEKALTEQQDGIFRFSYKRSLQFNVCLIPVIILLAFQQKIIGEENIAAFLFLMSCYPLTSGSVAVLQVTLRVHRANREYAISNIMHSGLHFLFCLILCRHLGVTAMIVSLYLADVVTVGVCVFYLGKCNFFVRLFRAQNIVSRSRQRELTSYGLFCALTNFTSTILVLLDVTCLNFVLKEPVILADYHVAASIPAACIFVPTSLITFFYPYMVEKMGEGMGAFKTYIVMLAQCFVFVSLMLSCFLLLFAREIILLLYGEQYVGVVPIFRILTLNFFINSSVRKLLGNVIAVLKEVRINLIHTTVAGILNIVLNLILIVKGGAIGAAIATLVVSAVVALLEILYLREYFVKHK